MSHHWIWLALLAAPLLACDSADPPEPSPEPPLEEAMEPDLASGIVLALAQFVEVDGKPVPGPGRAEFLLRRDGEWRVTSLEDPDSNVFHKVMLYTGAEGESLLTLGGTGAHVKTWAPGGGGPTPTTLWEDDFGGDWSRMRDAEVGDLYGDGGASIAVATHDQGVVATLRPGDAGFEVTRLDEEPDTFVHEIEIGDLDGDGTLEVYATPSEPNRLDGTPQSGRVVRYVPASGEGRVVVADLGERHAKEILVADVDGDDRDELYVVVEGVIADKRLAHPVEIRRYEADTPPDAGVVVARLQSDSMARFLTAGDIEGDGRTELVAAGKDSGLWLLRPGASGDGSWSAESIDRNSAGFEHASILTDLDGDGRDELYVASDKHKEVRRYTWNGSRLEREVIYVRPDDRPIFTWNLMPIPAELIPE